MGMPAVRRHWTSQAVRALIEASPSHWPRYELLDGELVVTPSPGFPHQTLVGELYLVLAEYLRREPVGAVFIAPADLELRRGNITQPDLFIVPPGCAPSAGPELLWSDIELLSVAIEVLSPTSVRTDRVTKREYYLDVGVPLYLVVDFDARMIEEWTADRDTPRVLREKLVWHPAGAKDPLTISLPELFDRVGSLRRYMGR